MRVTQRKLYFVFLQVENLDICQLHCRGGLTVKIKSIKEAIVMNKWI